MTWMHADGQTRIQLPSKYKMPQQRRFTVAMSLSLCAYFETLCGRWDGYRAHGFSKSYYLLKSIYFPLELFQNFGFQGRLLYFSIL